MVADDTEAEWTDRRSGPDVLLIRHLLRQLMGRMSKNWPLPVYRQNSKATVEPCGGCGTVELQNQNPK